MRKTYRFAQGFMHEFPINAAIPFIIPTAFSQISTEERENARRTEEYLAKDELSSYIAGGITGTIAGGLCAVAYSTFAVVKSARNPDFLIEAGVILAATYVASFLYEMYKKRH